MMEQRVEGEVETHTFIAVSERPFLQAVLNGLQGSVVILNADGTVLAMNVAWQRLARARKMVVGSSYLGLDYLEAHRAVCSDTPKRTKKLWVGIQGVLAGNLATFDALCSCVFPTEVRLFALNATPLGGRLSGAVVTYTDVTEQKRHEAELQKLAGHDSLTGLPNRRQFFTEASKALALAERHGHVFTLFYLDLDGFKAVNDANGHEVGDVVLCKVAERLRALLRKGDLIARLGGDEFLVLFQETGEGASLNAAQRYQDNLEQPFYIEGRAIKLRGSLGMAHYPRHGQTLDELVRCADSAMYRAKTAGGGTQVYD